MAKKEKQIERAQKFVMKGYFDKAIAEYKSIVALDPSDVSLRLRLGELYVKTGLKEEAIKEYSSIGKFNTGKGFYLKAIAVYKLVLKLDDTNLEIHNKLADLYTKQRLIADAIGEYSYILNTYEKKGRSNEAFDLLKKMDAIDPENVGLKLRLADMQKKLGYEDDALELYCWIFDKFLTKGKIDKAEDILRDLYVEHPKDLRVLEGLVNINKERGDNSQFITYASELIDSYKENGELEKVETLCESVLELAPDNEKAKVMLSELSGEVETEAGGMPEEVEVDEASVEDVLEDSTLSEELPSVPEEIAEAEKAEEPLQELPDEGIDEGEEPAQIEGGEEGEVALEAEEEQPLEPSLEEALTPEGEEPVEGLLEEAEEIDIDFADEEEEELFEVDFDDLEEDEETELLGAEIEEEVLPEEVSSEVVTEAGEVEAGEVEAEEVEAEVEEPVETGTLEDIVGEFEAEELEELEEAAEEVEGLEAAEQEETSQEEDVILEEELLEIVAEAPEEPLAETAVEEILEEEIEELDIEEEELEDIEEVDIDELPEEQLEEITEQALEEVEEEADVEVFDESGDDMLLEIIGADLEQKEDEGLEELPIEEEVVEEEEELVEVEQTLSDEEPDLSGTAAEQALEEGGAEAEAASEEGGVIDLTEELGIEEALSQLVDRWADGEASEMVEEFKAGIGEQLSREDVETHFNLGIAYMEMDLFEDAVREFKISANEPAFEFNSYARLGQCSVAMEKAVDAVGFYIKSLAVKGMSDRDRIGAMYELALAYSNAGEEADALHMMTAVSNLDPEYREVHEKLAELAVDRSYIPVNDNLIEIELL